MKDYYEDIFKKSFDVFHNLADDAYLPLTNKINFTFCESNPLKILFIGSLFETLHKGAINNICRAINELNDEGYSISFNLYGQIVPSTFLKQELTAPNINHYGTVSPDERFNIMLQNHCFVVPSSFAKNIVEEYRYSIPTKLPELLLSGRPVIIHGPKEMEAYRFCDDKKCGVLIDDNSISSLKSELVGLYLNYPKYKEDAINTSHKLMNRLSMSTQNARFQSFILN
jgi:hypothetical protein